MLRAKARGRMWLFWIFGCETGERTTLWFGRGRGVAIRNARQLINPLLTSATTSTGRPENTASRPSQPTSLLSFLAPRLSPESSPSAPPSAPTNLPQLSIYRISPLLSYSSWVRHVHLTRSLFESFVRTDYQKEGGPGVPMVEGRYREKGQRYELKKVHLKIRRKVEGGEK